MADQVTHNPSLTPSATVDQGNFYDEEESAFIKQEDPNMAATPIMKDMEEAGFSLAEEKHMHDCAVLENTSEEQDPLEDNQSVGKKSPIPGRSRSTSELPHGYLDIINKSSTLGRLAHIVSTSCKLNVQSICSDPYASPGFGSNRTVSFSSNRTSLVNGPMEPLDVDTTATATSTLTSSHSGDLSIINIFQIMQQEYLEEVPNSQMEAEAPSWWIVTYVENNETFTSGDLQAHLSSNEFQVESGKCFIFHPFQAYMFLARYPYIGPATLQINHSQIRVSPMPMLTMRYAMSPEMLLTDDNCLSIDINDSVQLMIRDKNNLYWTPTNDFAWDKFKSKPSDFKFDTAQKGVLVKVGELSLYCDAIRFPKDDYPCTKSAFEDIYKHADVVCVTQTEADYIVVLTNEAAAEKVN